MKIGFFDSGIGGLTVLHQALQYLPNEDYLFYADTQNVPYGEKSKEEVREYIFQGVDFLAEQNVKAVVIACNTATSIAVEDLRKKYPFTIIGIEPAVKPAVENCQKKVLVMATELTLKEAKYHNLVKSLGKEAIVDSISMPGLVRLAENFQFHREEVIPYLEERLASFDLEQYGTVVLGCTHFPYFTNHIKAFFPKHIDVISGNKGTAKNLKRILEEKNQLGQGTGKILYYQSGVLVEDKNLLQKYVKLLERMDNEHI